MRSGTLLAAVALIGCASGSKSAAPAAAAPAPATGAATRGAPSGTAANGTATGQAAMAPSPTPAPPSRDYFLFVVAESADQVAFVRFGADGI
ncbi:MAG: hypothetical protein U0132_22330, partial [Gemmatimonadaceae bacterium]